MAWICFATATLICASHGRLEAQDAGQTEEAAEAPLEDATEADSADFFDDPFSVDSEDAGDSDFFDDPFSVADQDAADDSDFFDDPFSIDNNDDAEAVTEGSLGAIDLDDLFGGEMIDLVEDPTAIANPQDDLLTQELIEWGGRIRGNLSAEWGWDTLWTSSFDPLDPPTRDLVPSLTTDLVFDARPTSDFRAFGKIKIESGSADEGFGAAINDAALTGDLPEGWTRVEENDEVVIFDEDGEEVFTVAADDEEANDPQTGNVPAVDLFVYELFSDFNYGDRLFFRFGKHTIRWGVGYFFSPADVLNLSAVDAEDPTADREGPVSLKAHYPFGINNLYLYLITNVGAKPIEIAVAPKIEFVVGSTELAFAAYYQRALSPRAITMISTSVEKVDFFGEAIVSLGSDRTFVRESMKPLGLIEAPPDGLETVLDTYTIDLLPIFSGTVGFRWIEDEKPRGSLAFLGQYLFNGEGYPDSDLLAPAAFLFQNPETNGLAVADEAAQPEGFEPPPDLTVPDVLNWGRHYLALSGSWSDILGSELSFSLFALANVSDLSGVITPSLSFPILDTFSATIRGRLSFGEPTDEFTNPASLLDAGSDNDGGTLSLSVSFGLGGGTF